MLIFLHSFHLNLELQTKENYITGSQVQASVALKRIDVFMNRDELKSKVEVVQENGSFKPEKETGGPGPEVDAEDAVEISDGTFQWETDQVTMS